MQTFVKNAIFGLCIAAAFLFVSSTARAQVLAGSGDVAGNVGFSNLKGVDGNRHINFGGSGGFNLSPSVTVLGEFSYLPMGSVTASGVTVKGSYQLYGGAVRYNFLPSTKVVPYAVLGFGGARLSAGGSAGGVSSTAAVNGYYAALGGGASCYLGSNWGIRPEVRWERQEFSISGTTTGQNAVLITGSVFYQWGGVGGKKKK